MRHTARRTTLHLLVLIFLIVFMPVPGNSSDVKGNYVALGFGLESCSTSVAERSFSLLNRMQMFVKPMA